MVSRKTKKGSTSSSDKKLPLNQSIPLGIQHVFAMFAGNITVPLIVAGVFGVTTGEKIFFNSNGIVCCRCSNNNTNGRL